MNIDTFISSKEDRVKQLETILNEIRSANSVMSTSLIKSELRSLNHIIQLAKIIKESK